MKTFTSVETFNVAGKGLVKVVQTTEPPRTYEKVMIDDACFRVTGIEWQSQNPKLYYLVVKYTSTPRNRSYDCPETKRRKEIEIRLIVKARELQKLVKEQDLKITEYKKGLVLRDWPSTAIEKVIKYEKELMQLVMLL